MPIDQNRRGRGIPKVAGTAIASAGMTTAAPGALLTGIADHIYVVHRITFQYPTDVTAIDMDIKIDGIYQEGTVYDYANVVTGGDITEISTVINTWVDPNPPTGYVICYKEFPTGIPLATGDTISIVGNSVTAATNYTSTGATDMSVILDYEDCDAAAYYANYAM